MSVENRPHDRRYGWLQRQPERPPLVVAHRGASGLAPENTLAAFQRAVELHTPALECDVHTSSDGVAVVLHDATLDRTTNGNGPVAEQSFEQIQRLDAGSWFGAAFAGERIPTLDEVLEVCSERARLFIELKVGGGDALANAALAAVDRHPRTAVAIITFDASLVKLVATRRPDLPLGYLVGQRLVREQGTAALAQTAGTLGAGFLSPEQTVADAALVQAAHAAGQMVSVWTVDDADRMRVLSDAGVEAITTNRPDVALDLFSAVESDC